MFLFSDKWKNTIVEEAQVPSEHLEFNTEHLKRSIVETIDAQYGKCRLIFKTSKYESFKNMNPVHTPGTCQWVFQHEKYLKWLANPKRDLLWISADPGCGKSVLSRAFIDSKLNNLGEQTVCYFFFKDDDDERNILSKALSALQNGKGLAQEDDKLWSILEAAAADPDAPMTICVLDALDECSYQSRAKLIDKICSFYNMPDSGPGSKARLKFFVTSRPYDSVQHPFRRIKGGFQDIRLYGEDENLQLRTEIDLVIKSHVLELVTEFNLDEATGKKLEERLLGTKDRTYLWIRLAIGSIRETFLYSEFPSIASIENVPGSVREAYGDILRKVSDKQRNIVSKVLLAIVGSRRPLTVGEMALILGLYPGLPEDQSLASVKVPKAHVEKNIKEWCGHFIFLEKSKIYLIHQTAKEFLTARLHDTVDAAMFNWSAGINILKAEYRMAVLCIDYLCLDGIDFNFDEALGPRRRQWPSASSDDSSSDETTQAKRAQAEMAKRFFLFNSDACYQSFLTYACTYWASHLEAANISDTDVVWERVSKLYDPKAERFQYCFKVAGKRILYADTRIINHLDQPASALHMAAMFGQMPVLRCLLEDEKNDLNQLDLRKFTPLIWACQTDKLEAVKSLIAAGSKINVAGAEHTALHSAAEIGRTETVQVLIDRGAETDAISDHRKGDAYTAIAAAAHHGRTEVVELLLDKGADIFLHRDDLNPTALETAAETNQVSILRLFTQCGAEKHPAYPDAFHRALSRAAFNNNLDAVRYLLAHSATVTNVDVCLSNALVEASGHGHLEIVHVLLEYRSDGCNTELDLNESLHGAVSMGYIKHNTEERKKTARLLLDRGADINTARNKESPFSEEFATVLQTAAASGNPHLVRMMLDAGAEVNFQDEVNGDALQVASYHQELDVMKVLIDAGADVNAQGGKYGSALFAAAWRGRPRALKMLLDRGARITDRVGPYGNLLHTAARGGSAFFEDERVELVHMLLDKNLDVNSTSDWGHPLQCASLRASLKVSRVLIDRGADVNAIGGRYGTALQAAIVAGVPNVRIAPVLESDDGQYEYTQMVKILVENGASIDIVAGEFGTALQAACWRGFGAAIWLLLKNGADVNISSGNRGSALQALASCKRLSHSKKSGERLMREFLDRGADLTKFGPEAKQAAWKNENGKMAGLLKDGLKRYAVIKYQPR